MNEQFVKLAEQSQNFGYLLKHEPLLVVDGATAETYVYSDPDAAMFKARRFTETLAKLLVSLTQTRWLEQPAAAPADQGARRRRRPGAADPGEVRQGQIGWQSGGPRLFRDVRAALTSVKLCFDLGYWFHRALVPGDEERRAFLPPPDPEAAAASGQEEQGELEALRRELREYRNRLAAIKVQRASETTWTQAEAVARQAAEEALRQALADRDQLQDLAGQANARLSELEAAFESQCGRTARCRRPIGTR